MIALVGDAELDEGNIYETLIEGYKHGLRNTWWIIDYNRQSLDGVIREGLYTRFEEMFRAVGLGCRHAEIRPPDGKGVRTSPAAKICANGSTKRRTIFIPR